MSLAVGLKAPEFALKDQSQKEVKLSDFAGKKNVVLVFYPLDWSPVCTNEHVCLVNDMKAFETLDAEVLGVSVDSVWSHKAFADKMDSQIIAEGIEREGERQVLVDLGIEYGQGFLLGRPAEAFGAPVRATPAPERA